MATKTISYSEAREHLKKYLDYVADNNDPIIIKRKNGKNVVIIAEEDYNAMNETDYLLSSPKNKELLLATIKDIENGNDEGSVTFNSTEEMDAYFAKYIKENPDL